MTALATSQTLEFTGFASKTASINQGTVNIDFGTWNGSSFTQDSTTSFDVTSSNNTLTGIASSLSALTGVNATVTNKGDGTYSLIVNTDTGAKNSIRIRVTDATDETGLAAKFDTSDNAEQVVAAQDASLNINGVQVTRASNKITDLIDGYEFKLNSVTTTAASVSSSIDSDVAYAKVKEFVDLYNGVTGTIDNLTKIGVDGEDSGILARDVVVNGIERKLRSIMTSQLDGYGETGRYISELGLRTERDGSISLAEADFKKAFSAEPILFDVMMNSLATSDNPNLKVEHTSEVLQPKGGVYNFIGGGDGTGASLGGTSLTGSVLSNGDIKYVGVSGDISGLKLEGPATVTSAKVYYGQSFMSKLTKYIDELVATTGTLANSKTKATKEIADYSDEQTNLDERIASLRERYMNQFSAMESAVTGFKKTGEFLTGFIDALNPSD